jgi:short-subunit dehydrogenase
MKKSLDNKIALITGGAQGIGKLMAQELLKRNAQKVILWDVNQTELDKALAELNTLFPSRATGLVIDVRNSDQIEAALKAEPKIDILINNAGVIRAGAFKDQSQNDIDVTIDVNVKAPMHLTRLVLPGMLSRGGGNIVNISSASSLSSVPLMATYCASKWAMTGWSDSLRIEMEMEKQPIKVLTVFPYYIATGMFSGVNSLIPILKPHYVAKKIIDSMMCGCVQLKMPRLLYFSYFLRGIMPLRVFDLVVGWGMGFYRSMKTFKGRQG